MYLLVYRNELSHFPTFLSVVILLLVYLDTSSYETLVFFSCPFDRTIRW